MKLQNKNKYPSDISRRQFELIRKDLENVRKRTKPRTVDLYEVFCALLYVLKSGCQWRMLPSDFPKWRTVYEYYRKWGEVKEEGGASVLEQALKKIGWSGPVKTWTERTHQFLHN